MEDGENNNVDMKGKNSVSDLMAGQKGMEHGIVDEWTKDTRNKKETSAKSKNAQKETTINGEDDGKQGSDGSQTEQRKISQNGGKGERMYKKEATVVIDVSQNNTIKAEDIIKAINEVIGRGKLLAVRPTQ